MAQVPALVCSRLVGSSILGCSGGCDGLYSMMLLLVSRLTAADSGATETGADRIRNSADRAGIAQTEQGPEWAPVSRTRTGQTQAGTLSSSHRAIYGTAVRRGPRGHASEQDIAAERIPAHHRLFNLESLWTPELNPVASRRSVTSCRAAS